MKRPNNPQIGSKYAIASRYDDASPKIGEVITLKTNDGTDTPLFSRNGAFDISYHWGYLKPITDKESL